MRTLTHWAVLGLACLSAAGPHGLPQWAGGTGVPPVSDSGSLGLRPVPGATDVATDRVEGGAPQRDGRDARTTHTLDFPNFENVPYVIESGLLDNPSDEYAVVFSHEVHLPGAAWLRLFYDRATLVGDSRVRVTSLLDGDVQELNAAILKQWSNTSAYFNGDRVLLELLAGPGTRGNELSLGQVQMQAGPTGGGVQTAAACGPDDRVPSYEDWAARTKSGGCSASIISTSSCMVGAGHCVDNDVLQFRVPPSQLIGELCFTVNPPADDQFPTLPGWQSRSNGVGDDWWVARVGMNGLGQRPFDRYGQLRHIVNTTVPVGARTKAVGYGTDTPCAVSQTQQTGPGTIKVDAGTYYRFDNDVSGGSSGSGLLYNERIVCVVTGGTASCTNWNFGTKTGNADFVAARLTVCGDCLTDLTGDGQTNQADLARLLAAYGSIAGQAGYDYVADLDDDNMVGQSDLALLLTAYDVACP